MLATANGDENLEVVKLLLQSKADISLKDPVNNNLLHIASRYESAKILDYLIQNSRLNPLERNIAGETPLSIATASQNKQLAELMKKYEDKFDETKKTTDELLNELERDE